MFCHAALIGAGTAGLGATCELSREGYLLVVFERAKWVAPRGLTQTHLAMPQVELQPGLVFTALSGQIYIGEIINFREYPFLARNDGTADPRRFRGHWEVLMQLKEFSREFGIEANS